LPIADFGFSIGNPGES
jgi:hypothetical protein